MFDLNMEDSITKPAKARVQDTVSGDTLDSIVNNAGYGSEKAGQGPADSLSTELMNGGLKTPSGNVIRPVPMQIDASKVRVSKFNKRDQNNLDVTDLEPLIKQAGTNLVPALVRPVLNDPNYKFEAIYGSRRRLACERNKVPLLALCADMSDEDAIYFATEENMGNKDLSPFEWSEQYQLFINSKSPLYNSIGDLAKGLGFGRQHASKIYNLKSVPSELYSRIDRSNITIRKACLVKKLWDAIESEQKTAFLKELREEPQVCLSLEEIVERLSNVSPVLIFESEKKEREYGHSGRTIVTKTKVSGGTKVEFVVDSKLTEEQYKELETFILKIDNSK